MISNEHFMMVTEMQKEQINRLLSIAEKQAIATEKAVDFIEVLERRIKSLEDTRSFFAKTAIEKFTIKVPENE